VRGGRRVTAGLVDQGVIALANAGNTVLALVLLSRARSGTMLLTLSLAYLVMYINRAFVGDVLLALASRYDGDRRDRLVRNGLAAAAALGAAAAAVLLAVWVVWPRGGKIDLRDLVWIAPFLPIILVHDTGRFSYLADRRPERALMIDLTWVGTQALAVIAMMLLGLTGAGGLFVCWGIGAAAGATLFLARTGHRPWRGRPQRWLAETRHLSGWFTATALVGQLQVQAVGFIVSGQLSRSDLSGLRGGQVALIQPVQNFITAVQGLVVPRASRMARDAARLPGAEGAAAGASLRRLTRLLALAFTGLAVVMVAVMWPVASLVLTHFHKFSDIAPLALPMSLQAAIYVVQVPFTAALRAMHRARMLFLQYVIFTVVSLTGLVIGAHRSGLEGASWGLTTGAAVGLALMIILYRFSLRWLGTAEPDRFEQAEAADLIDTPTGNVPAQGAAEATTSGTL
jgi:O-antigen/teichoic acid export membrane protein